MKKIFTLTAVMLIAFSCTKDAESQRVQISGEDGNTQFNHDFTDGYCTLAIQTDEEWFITQDSDSELWSVAYTDEGEGNANVKIGFDYNLGDDARVATFDVTTKSGDIATYTIYQDAYMSDENDETTATKIYTYMSKGLGHGYEISSSLSSASYSMAGIKKTAYIFNSSNITDLIASNDLDSYCYSEASISQDDVTIEIIDSVVDKQDSIGASLTINVTFSSFTLGLSGSFVSSEEVNTHDSYYYTFVSYPVHEAYIDGLSIAARGEEAYNETTTKQQMFYSSGFYSMVKNITTKVQKGEDATAYLKRLVQNYGAMYISGSTMGGELFIEVNTSTSDIDDVMAIEGCLSATVGEIVDAEAHAAYVKAGETVLKDAKLTYTAKGGSVSARSGLLTNLINLADGEGTSDDLNSSVESWYGSVALYDDNSSSSVNSDSNAELISVTLDPIWNLFPDIEVSMVVEEYIRSFYSKMETSVDLNNF